MFKDCTNYTLDHVVNDSIITFWQWNNPCCDMVPLTQYLSDRVTLVSSSCFTQLCMKIEERWQRVLVILANTIWAPRSGNDWAWCQTQRQIEGAVILCCALSDTIGRLQRQRRAVGVELPCWSSAARPSYISVRVREIFHRNSLLLTEDGQRAQNEDNYKQDSPSHAQSTGAVEVIW